MGTFLDYLVACKGHNQNYYSSHYLELFYKHVRCGLVHNGYITAEGISFFVDRFKIDNLHLIYPNHTIENSILINTFNMLEEIDHYIDHYIKLVQIDGEIKNNFEKMFDMFFQID